MINLELPGIRRLLLLFFFMVVGADLSHSKEIDPETVASPALSYNTKAVVQIRPAFDTYGRACTAIQIEPKILLLAGHCVGYLKKSVLIPQWSTSQSAFKVAAKLRQAVLSDEGTPLEQVDPAHDLALLLVQPKGCGDQKEGQKDVVPLQLDAKPNSKSQAFELAAYGGSGVKFARIKDGSTPSFEAIEQTHQLQTTTGRLLDCSSAEAKKVSCQKTQELIQSFRHSDGALYSVAKRTIEITHTPVIREMVTRREGPLFLEGDSGAVMIQTDESNRKIIRGVLSGTGAGMVEEKKITVLRSGKAPLEVAVAESSVEWVDPSRSSLSFDSVKKALASRQIDADDAEIRRSYSFTSIHFFSSVHHPKNKEFLEKGLEELRKKRDEKFGCD